jgi:hypothetical protein
MQCLGGAREIAVLSHGDQVAQGTQFHGVTIRFSYRRYPKQVLDCWLESRDDGFTALLNAASSHQEQS